MPNAPALVGIGALVEEEVDGRESAMLGAVFGLFERVDPPDTATFVGVGARVGAEDGGFMRGDGTLIGAGFGFFDDGEPPGTPDHVDTRGYAGDEVDGRASGDGTALGTVFGFFDGVEMLGWGSCAALFVQT